MATDTTDSPDTADMGVVRDESADSPAAQGCRGAAGLPCQARLSLVRWQPDQRPHLALMGGDWKVDWNVPNWGQMRDGLGRANQAVNVGFAILPPVATIRLERPMQTVF